MSRATLLEMLIQRSRGSSPVPPTPSIPTDYVFYAPLIDNAAATAATGQPLSYAGTVQNAQIDGVSCLYLQSGNVRMTDTTVVPTGNHAFTQSIWVRFPSLSKGALFAYGVNSTYGSIHLQSNNTSGKINGGGWYLDYELMSNAQTDRWYHFLQTYDGTKFDGYVDGTLVATANNTNVNVQAGGISIGVQPGGSSEQISSLYVCAARLYDRVLTSEEITALANEDFSGQDSSSSSESSGSDESSSGSESQSESHSGGTVRFAAGVDTNLYLDNTNGVFVATPSGDWGGTGYHDGIKGTWVSFYPKHGVKYSLDGGTTWLDWCFEDTNATLDLSSVGTTIAGVTKVSGRDYVSRLGQRITVSDPSSSSAIYVFDVEMT